MPQLRLPQVAFLTAFLFTYPLGFMTPQLCFIANLLGLLRKAGMVKFSLEYLQTLVYFEEFANVTYLISVFVTRGGLMIYGPLLISAGLALAIEFKRMLDANPSTPVLSSQMVKEWVIKGSQPALQDQGRQMKADLEIYAGIYLIVGIFIGGSTLMNALMFWQMMRLRYMMNSSV
mmetsp:Transcript_17783/g.30123  ORF Transcript_17783/g.30123 Transcript_17783/m.30123 type:complete len:175 (+) Transcript_17783:392-916(+)